MQAAELNSSRQHDAEENTLAGCECMQCGRRFVPPRAFCTDCGSNNRMKAVRIAGPGKLYSHSVVHIAPKGFKAPYAVGYVDLPGDIRVLGQIFGWNNSPLRQGMTMEIGRGAIGIEPDGSIRESFIFRPAAHSIGKEQ
jgi:uncharacterized OB-fold protein